MSWLNQRLPIHNYTIRHAQVTIFQISAENWTSIELSLGTEAILPFPYPCTAVGWEDLILRISRSRRTNLIKKKKKKTTTTFWRSTSHHWSYAQYNVKSMRFLRPFKKCTVLLSRYSYRPLQRKKKRYRVYMEGTMLQELDFLEGNEPSFVICIRSNVMLATMLQSRITGYTRELCTLVLCKPLMHCDQFDMYPLRRCLHINAVFCRTLGPFSKRKGSLSSFPQYSSSEGND